ncbi:hypothetical protein ACTFIW_003612 [Dictyostelium discoideum]
MAKLLQFARHWVDLCGSVQPTIGGLLYTISTSETCLFSLITSATPNKKYHHHHFCSKNLTSTSQSCLTTILHTMPLFQNHSTVLLYNNVLPSSLSNSNINKVIK